MKRFITVLSGLLVLPAFAEVAPIYYDEIVEYTDDMIDAVDAAENEAVESQSVQKAQPRTNINRSSSRAISAGATSATSRANTSSRAMAANPRATVSRGTTSRTTARTATPTRVSARSAASTKPVTARVGVSGTTGPRTVTASTIKTLNDSNVKYNATGTSKVGSETASRVGIANRRSTARMSTPVAVTTTTAITQEDVNATSTNMNALAELTDLCKSQYAACMDNYCNVLDDNQGRCSCSKNVKNYEKTEETLKAATEQFQDVIQKIKYIGLTGEQIETLFTETEAEVAMRSNTDKSQLKTSLDSIKRKIVDVSSPNASSYEAIDGLSFDLSGLLNADFTAGFDLTSFFNTTSKKSTTSVVNQRGDQLYKSATNRCKTQVLDNCVVQGVEANVIVNAYDLEIDKQCVLYERSLNEANDEMRNNVRNASTILQQARLMLAQNRNAYDVRGCVAAIDACMQDEYVCGSDYELCLDPTGKYIANGEIVIGGTPGVSGGMQANECPIYHSNATKWTSGGMFELYQTWNYKDKKVGNAVKTTNIFSGDSTCSTEGDAVTNPAESGPRNAWGMGQSETLGAYINAAMNNWSSKKVYTSTEPNEDMATYLLQKIGYIDENDKVHGMCASVMKQCQDYTYTKGKSKKEYSPDNEVIRQYLASTLTKIKLAQDEILANYAEDCRSDVTSCLSSNGYDESNVYTTASQTAVNACRAYIQTCMSVGGWKPSDNTKLTLREMSDWIGSILTTCPENYYLYESGKTGTTWTSECRVCPTALVLVATDFEADNNAPKTAAALDGMFFTANSVGFKKGNNTDTWFTIGTSTFRIAGKTGPVNGTPWADTTEAPYAACGANQTTSCGQSPIVQLASSGGQVTSCDCPSGFTSYTYRYTTTDTESGSTRWKAGETKVFCIFTPEKNTTDGDANSGQ